MWMVSMRAPPGPGGSHYTAQSAKRSCAMIIIHGGRVLRPGTFDDEPLDLIVDGDTIVDLVAPASVRTEAAQRIDASGKLLIPGLVNGHTHAQVALARGVFDRYTLELYLNAMAWTTGRRTLEDKYVS